MKIFGFGTDLVNIKRIKKVMSNNKSFKNRIYSSLEIKMCEKRKDKYNCYAKRFAAKEAFSKALGTGISQEVEFKNIVVNNDKNGKPFIKLKGKILNKTKKIIKKKNFNILLTLTDEKPFAAATVILIKQ